MGLKDFVKLVTVWKWGCPDCGAVNYVEGVPATDDQVDEETKADLREAMKDDPEAQRMAEAGFDVCGEFVIRPEVVECGKCGQKSLADDPEEENTLSMDEEPE